MPARGVLYIEYAKDAKGNMHPEPYFHDLKTITVSGNQDCQHGFQYTMENGFTAQFFFEPNGIGVFLSPPEGVEATEEILEEMGGILTVIMDQGSR